MPVVVYLGRDKNIEKAIKQLQNPQDIVFEFLILLKKIGINLSGYDFFDEELLWDMEVGKYEIVSNAKNLIEQGLPESVVSKIICGTSLLMMLSEIVNPLIR